MCYFAEVEKKRDIIISQRNAEKTILRRCCRLRVIIIFAVILAVGIGIDKLTTKNADRESGQSRKKFWIIAGVVCAIGVVMFFVESAVLGL